MRAIVLASTALVLLSSPAFAYDPVVDTRKIMAGTVTTLSIKNEYLSGKRDGTTQFQGALKAYKAVREAEQPVPAPTPVPQPTPTPTPTPVPAPSSKVENKVVQHGDSISAYATGYYTGLFDSARPNVTVCNYAVSGSDIGAVIGRIDKTRACNGEVVTILIGANDLYNGQLSVTVDMWLGKLFAHTDQLRAEGYKVAVGTILPQCCINSAAYIAEFTRRRPIANAAIRAAVGKRIDAVIDFAANPIIGPDSAASNKALFPDGLHPSSGYPGDASKAHAIMASIYGPVVDKLLGDTAPAPAPTPVPAPTPTPTPPPTAQLRAIQACMSPFPLGIDAQGVEHPFHYPKLSIGDTFDPIAKGLTHDTKPLTTVSAGTFLSTCFG